MKPETSIARTLLGQMWAKAGVSPHWKEPRAQEAVYVCVQKHLLIVLISHEMFVLLSLWEQIYVYVCVLRRVSVISILFSHIWSIYASYVVTGVFLYLSR